MFCTSVYVSVCLWKKEVGGEGTAAGEDDILCDVEVPGKGMTRDE